MSRALEGVGYTMGEPTNKADADEQLDASVVYFDAAGADAEAVAGRSPRRSAASTIEAMPPCPRRPRRGELGGASVLVMLGTDKAGKTLAELTGATSDTTATGELATGGGRHDRSTTAA